MRVAASIQATVFTLSVCSLAQAQTSAPACESLATLTLPHATVDTAVKARLRFLNV